MAYELDLQTTPIGAILLDHRVLAPLLDEDEDEGSRRTIVPITGLWTFRSTVIVRTHREAHTHTHARARARSRPSAVRGPLEYCQYSVFIILLPVIKLVKISSFSLLPVLCLLSILLTMRLAVNL